MLWDNPSKPAKKTKMPFYGFMKTPTTKKVAPYRGKAVTLSGAPSFIKPYTSYKTVSSKNMNWTQASRKYPSLPMFGDADGDGIYNGFDCKPFDKKRQGPEHTVVMRNKGSGNPQFSGKPQMYFNNPSDAELFIADEMYAGMDTVDMEQGEPKEWNNESLELQGEKTSWNESPKESKKKSHRWVKNVKREFGVD